MAEGEKVVEAARPRRGSKRTAERRRVVRRTSAEREQRRAERLDDGAEIEAREGDISHMSWTVIAGKLK